MDKVYKLLHKKYDKKFNKTSSVKEKKIEMENLFKSYNIEYKQENELSFFHNEICYQGILNKQEIERAYFEGKVLMNDFYDTLDYEEKKRLMNYEIQKVKPTLPYRMVEGKPIFIPFFDFRLNQIYENEMVLFDIKKYNYYVRRFENIMIDFHSLYDNQFYGNDFCSAELVYENQNQLSLYCDLTTCLYFVEDLKLVNHLTLRKKMDEEILKNISYSYFNVSFIEFIDLLEGLELIEAKEMKKIRKMIKKGKS
ncbi:hypothetical protein M2475_001768 [Breznakia sp. PF5-3]|uniref:hypothetical protein n=1 Tax=unclassified Breznakia TaxID=2623764 RepID=UPI00240727A0|nr:MULTISPECIES: hypothetical protein [unclassified Breznakia]MDF9825337.1 hypothetical protein [Breznakia sp. PM6-1]MDF9836192.1 hypothetical protein [Breznakia sp. PF5-3]MDF9838410.1 hypothetical protein [Breznakia sp. PFB2-8]MDF9860426.1 hypothetical protein [Breznakia sp. PH5-24]